MKKLFLCLLIFFCIKEKNLACNNLPNDSLPDISAFETQLRTVVSRKIGEADLAQLCNVILTQQNKYLAKKDSAEDLHKLLLMTARFEEMMDTLYVRRNFKGISKIAECASLVYISVLPVDSTYFIGYVIESLDYVVACNILTKNFSRAREVLEQIRQFDPNDGDFYPNLAICYLFENQYPKAEEIYLRLRNQVYPYDKDKTYREVFLEGLDLIEKEGLTHPDFAKARKLLQGNR